MLDERTIFLMLVVLPVLLAGIAFVARYGIGAEARGMGPWAVSLLCLSAAALLVASGLLQGGWFIWLPYVFWIPSVLLSGWTCARTYRDAGTLPRHLPVTLSAVGVAMFAAVGLTSFDAGVGRLRVVGYQVFHLAMLGWALREALRGGVAQAGLGARVVAFGLTVMALGSATRGLEALLHDGTPVRFLSGDYQPVLLAYFIAISVAVLLVTIGLMLTAFERVRARLQLLAVRDPLTGLMNRQGLSDCATPLMSLGRRERQEMALLVIDIDHFKQVNDQNGHDIGDYVLVAVADCLRQLVRQHDACARVGGEEFVVLMPNTGLQGALQLAERIRAAVAQLSVQKGKRAVHVTCSIGAVAMPAPEHFEELFQRADAAMYRAKESGRNRVEWIISG